MSLFKSKKTDDLAAAIEEYRQNTPAQRSGNGRLLVEDVFYITGCGCGVTGKVENGSFCVGDAVQISTLSGVRARSEILSIECCRKQQNVAQPGDVVGLLLRDMKKADVCAGDIIEVI